MGKIDNIILNKQKSFTPKLTMDNGAVLVPSLNKVIDHVNILTLITTLNYLVNMGKLTSQELTGLHNMLISPDKENHTVAFSIIKKLSDEINFSELSKISPDI